MSSGVKSSDPEDHARKPPLLIYLFGKRSFKNWRTVFQNVGALHPDGTVHRNATVALRNVLTCPGTNGLPRLLPESRSNDAIFHDAHQTLTLGVSLCHSTIY